VRARSSEASPIAPRRLPPQVSALAIWGLEGNKARAHRTCVEQPEAEQQQQQQRQRRRRAEPGAAALLSPGGSGGGGGAGRCCSQAHARPCRSRGLRRGWRRGRRGGSGPVAAAWAGGHASLPLLPPSGQYRRWTAATAAESGAPRAERVGGGGNGAQRHRGGRAEREGRERRHKDRERVLRPVPSGRAPRPWPAWARRA
jgi:hypothetical protein